MIFISHRGNINKINKSEENNPEKILSCISQGYNVEIDVWNVKDKFYLGHDEPQYEVSIDFFNNEKLWCHAKNLNALTNLLSINNINCFWHESDSYTLTSKGFIWAFPGSKLCSKSICVLPETKNYKLKNMEKCFGICSDNIEFYKQKLKELL